MWKRRKQDGTEGMTHFQANVSRFVKSETEGKCNKARVLPEQPKKNSLNKSWVNVLVEGDKKPSSINCDMAVR